MRTQIRKNEVNPANDLFPLILGKEPDAEPDRQELKKLELFEKGLAKELKKDDSIGQAITKIVKLALAAEFGPSLVVAQGAQRMITTISAAITNDPKLRKQALIIIERFTKSK